MCLFITLTWISRTVPVLSTPHVPGTWWGLKKSSVHWMKNWVITKTSLRWALNCPWHLCPESKGSVGCRQSWVRRATGTRLTGQSKAGLEKRERWMSSWAEVRQEPQWWRAPSLSSCYPFGLPAKTIWWDYINNCNTRIPCGLEQFPFQSTTMHSSSHYSLPSPWYRAGGDISCCLYLQN